MIKIYAAYAQRWPARKKQTNPNISLQGWEKWSDPKVEEKFRHTKSISKNTTILFFTYISFWEKQEDEFGDLFISDFLIKLKIGKKSNSISRIPWGHMTSDKKI